MSRLYQILLIASTLVLSWLGIQAVHELGHVLGAWAGGETVSKVVLHPLMISRIDASHDRHPCWSCGAGQSSARSCPSPSWASPGSSAPALSISFSSLPASAWSSTAST